MRHSSLHLDLNSMCVKFAMLVTPIMHHSPRRPCCFCLKQEDAYTVNVASWFLNIHNCFTMGPL